MIKINSIKLLTSQKIIQVFSIVAITAFLIVLFCMSVFYISEKIVLWDKELASLDSYYIGFFKIVFDGEKIVLHLSETFIILITLICILLAILIINSIFLYKNFNFDLKIDWTSSLIFIFSSIFILFFILLFYFVNTRNYLNLNSNGWFSMNLIINYHCTSIDNNYSIVKMNLSSFGIFYTVFNSYMFLGLLYLPFKMLYNLLKANYI